MHVTRAVLTAIALAPAIPVTPSLAAPYAMAQPDAADEVARAIAAVERARAAYLALKSYSDTTRARYVWEPANGRRQESSAEIATRYRAPGDLAISSTQDAMIAADGRLRRIALAGGVYTDEPLPSPFNPMEHVEGMPSGWMLASPVAVLLVRGEQMPPLLFKNITELTGARAAEQGGVAGTLVTASGRYDPDDEASPTTEIELFFRDSDGLLGSMQVDYTGANNAESPGEWRTVVLRYEFDEVRVNPDLPEDAFALPSGLREVDDLTPDAARPTRSAQMALIGSEAPAFEGADLDGEEMSLADLRGRVVVLDFWATWCGPCVAAMPKMQALGERFADRPVTVLGVNQDRGDVEAVRRFVQSKRITFGHFMDEDGSVGAAYRVTGIPCTVLIDAQGVVQDIRTGMRPGDEEVLAANIERLLKGESLRSPEELAELRRQLAEEASRPALAFASSDEQRLTVGRLFGRGYYSRYSTTVMNVDDDPANEVVNPTQNNGLEVLDHTGQDLRHIVFRGLPRGEVSAYAPVVISGARHWLIAHNRRESRRGSQITIGLFTDAGDRVWLYEPDALAGTFAQAGVAAGDLDGDGVPEMVVGIGAIRSNEDSGLEFGPGNETGLLIVLDAEGNPLAQRAMDQVDFVHVGVPDGTEGGRGVIVIGVNGRLRRVNLELP